MDNTIRVPEFNGKSWTEKEQSYEEVLDSYKKSFDSLPDVVEALKRADNEKWGQLFNDLGRYMKENPKINKIVRENTKNGQTGLSVGEPNWFWVPVMLAFGAGYAVGTACYKAGPCKLS